MNSLPFLILPAAALVIPLFLCGAFALSGACLFVMIVGAGVQELIAS